MSRPAPAPGGWHPDPYRRHELRYHDGVLWTEHVSDRGLPGLDTVPVAALPRSQPPVGAGGIRLRGPAEGKEHARVVPEFEGPDGDFLGAPILVVDEPALGSPGPAGVDCAVHDQHDQRLGTVRISAERLAGKALRLLTADPHPEVISVVVLDAAGGVLLTLTRPARHLRPRVTVHDSGGCLVGSIVQRQLYGRLRFSLEAGGEVVGTLDGDDPTDRAVAVHLPSGEPVARTSRTWEVLAHARFTRPDTYVVQVLRPLPEPVRSLALAAMMALEPLLVQDIVPSPEGVSARRPRPPLR